MARTLARPHLYPSYVTYDRPACSIRSLLALSLPVMRRVSISSRVRCGVLLALALPILQKFPSQVGISRSPVRCSQHKSKSSKEGRRFLCWVGCQSCSRQPPPLLHASDGWPESLCHSPQSDSHFRSGAAHDAIRPHSIRRTNHGRHDPTCPRRKIKSNDRGRPPTALRYSWSCITAATFV